MKVATFNANGIRSSIRKGFKDWVIKNDIDILCIQETKGKISEIKDDISLPGYKHYFKDAEKRGYSGVLTYSKQNLILLDELIWPNIISKTEGRCQVMQIKDVTIINTYLPSGSSGEIRQNIKRELIQDFKTYLEKFTNQKTIVLGDFNIAHQNIDLKNWKANQKTSGFLDYERQWMTSLLEDGWIDTFRHLHPEKSAYTWWSARSKRARPENIGWRIDYQIISKAMVAQIVNANIDNEVILSDHAPYIVEYNI